MALAHQLTDQLINLGNFLCQISNLLQIRPLDFIDTNLCALKDFSPRSPSRVQLFEPRREKTGLRGFRPGPTQTGLYSLRKELEA